MVFVTGATGFLGSYLCLYLIEKGYQIKASKRASSKIPEVLTKHSSQIEWIDLDLLDFFAVKDAMLGCEAVFHCAAQVSLSANKKKSLWKNNVDVTSNVVNVALEIEGIHFIYVSSIAAIGDAKPNELIDENCRWVYKKTSSDYSVSKFEAEREVWRGIHEGLKAVIVNPSVILGYDYKGRGTMGLIKQVQKGLKFYTTGIVGYVDVNDVAQCMIKLYEQKIVGERFIVSGANHSFKEIFDIIAKSAGLKVPSFEAKPWMVNLMARVIQLINKNHPLNRFTAKSAFNISKYNNHKIIAATGISFRSIETSINNMLNKKLS